MVRLEVFLAQDVQDGDVRAGCAKPDQRRPLLSEEVMTAARASGATYLAVDAGDDVEELLLSSWRSAGVLR